MSGRHHSRKNHRRNRCCHRCGAVAKHPRKGIDIPVPFDPSGKCMTSCTKMSHAVCDWWDEFPVEELRAVGSMPGNVLHRIIAGVEGVLAAEEARKSK